MARKSAGRAWSVTLDVVGLQFRWTKDGRDMLARCVPFKVVLEREPDNPADENAIKVMISSDHKLTKLRGSHLGYLRKTTAALMAPKLDAGSIEPDKLWVTSVDDHVATIEARFRDKPVTRRKKNVKSET